MKKSTRNSLLLVLTAFIWGTAFVAQSSGGDVVGPWAFNCIRNIIAGFVLIPVIFLLDRLGLSRKPETKSQKKTLVIAGIIVGSVLFIASNFQQVGISAGTPAGKAGFLTACYIVLVPILGMFIGKKTGWNIWVSVGLTVIGLYLLCMNGSLSVQYSDLLVAICALAFSFHILVIDHYSPLVDGVRLSCIQFFTCGILGIIPSFIFDMGGNAAGINSWLPCLSSADAWIAILYAGVMSSGVAYTLQIIGQQDVNPTVASLLMSLESVFSVIAGFVILHETLTSRELGGCVIIFAAVILAQLPMDKLIKKKALE